MTLTPHIVSKPELTEDDLRSFLVGGENSPLLFEAPSPASPAGPPKARAAPDRADPAPGSAPEPHDAAHDLEPLTNGPEGRSV